MASNRKSGADFERTFGEMLASKGIWAHLMRQDASGQPADVIAVARGLPILIDCKVCESDRFEFRRMEPNQRDAMDYWLSLGNPSTYFALQDSKGRVYLLNYQWAKAYEEAGHASVRCETNGTYVMTFEEWIAWVG